MFNIDRVVSTQSQLCCTQLSAIGQCGDPNPTEDNYIGGEPEVAALCSKATRT